MIKGSGFGKLLKQFFIIGLISCFGFGVNSSVNAVLEISGNAYYGDLGTPFTEGLYTYEISPDLNFTSEIGTSSFNGFYRQSSYWGSSPYEKDVIGWVNGNLYAFLGNVGGSNDNDLNTQGFFDKWCVVPVSVNPGVYNSVYGCEGKFTTSISDILEFNPNFTNFTIEKIGFTSPSVLGGVLQLCFKDSSNYYCVACSPGNCPSGLTGSNNYSISNMDFNTFVSFPFSSSPLIFDDNEVSYNPGIDDYNYVVISDDDLVFYFENNPFYKFNKNVCYVGTNDYNSLLSSVYNSGLVLNLGSGGDIFDLYFDKYGDNFTIKQVGSFINTWSSNYGTIFLTNENDRLFWLEYNGNGTVSQYYDNLTINRFLNNPYVFYNLGQITYNFGSQSTIGEEIATYCYYKLGYNEDSQGLTIIDNHDQSYNNNAGNYIDNYNKNTYRSGNINIISQSWAGTPLDYFTGDDNLDFSTFFSKSFNKFKDTFTITNQDLGAGFLPTYIILFLMAIVLFKFISH